MTERTQLGEGRAVAQQTRGHMRSRFFASNSSLLMSPRA
jgi:hypothetical protein